MNANPDKPRETKRRRAALFGTSFELLSKIATPKGQKFRSFRKHQKESKGEALFRG
jgi:hypothetical protein